MSVYLTRALDFALPRNPVTQNRELHFIPTFVEKPSEKAPIQPIYGEPVEHYKNPINTFN